MMKKVLRFYSICLIAAIFPLFAGESSILEGYICEGLKSNLSLQQQEFSLEKSLAAISEARSYFFPSLGLHGRFSVAGGGRVIDFPVGDLLNPIYASLNELYRAHGMPAQFPTDIPNEQIPFLRPTEQETRLRLIQPLFNAPMFFNLRIKSSLAKSEKAVLDAFRRKLVMEIKCAYFNYLKAVQAVELLEQVRLLLEENLRVSRSLFGNGKATEDIIFRAEAQLAQIDQKLAEMIKNRTQSRAFFNFLLNRPFDSVIESDPSVRVPEKKELLETLLEKALQKRDEFVQLDYTLKASAQHVRLIGTNQWPSLAGALDYGIQGESYRFGRDDDYWMATLVLEWNIFDGGRTRAQKIQALIDKKRLELKKAELKKMVRLQLQEEYKGLEAAELALTAALRMEKSARSSFEIVTAKYRNGMAPQVEYLDAQTTFSEAAMSVIIARYDCLIQRSKLEHAAALIDLEAYK